MKLSKDELISFGNLQSLSKMALIAINEKLCIKHMNAYAKKLLGITDDNSIVNKSIIEVFKQLHLRPLINNKGKIVNTNLMQIKNKFQKWKKISTRVENENWSLLIGYTIDWDKKLYDRFLKKESKSTTEKDYIYLNSILENLPELVYWKDKNFIYQGCNKNAAELLGYKTPADIIGKSDKDLGHDFSWSKERIKRLQVVDSSIIKKGASSFEEDAIPISGITKIYLTSKTPLHNKEGKIIGILGISTDITDRKKLEKDLIIAKEAAEKANQAKTEFIANMSHDIRTPLTGVIGMSEYLEKGAQCDNIKQYAYFIHESGKQLLSLLTGILEMVSSGVVHENEIHKERFNLYKLLNGLIQLERPTTEIKGLKLELKLGTDIPKFIVSDRTKIHRILLNLMGNAIKFTQEGKITIEVKLLKKYRKYTVLEFCVRDTGIGIPKNKQHQVFDKFFRVNPSYKGEYKGFGIGLHIAQEFVRILGGEIKLKSELGVGTTFYFNLRVGNVNEKDLQITAQKNIETPSPIPHQALPLEKLQANILDGLFKNEMKKKPKGKVSNENILIVEDNHIIRKLSEVILHEAGCRFSSVSNGEQGFERITTENFDLVLTDIGLPGISGMELTHQIREWEIINHLSPIPIVGLSAHTQEKSLLEECIKSGMNAVYIKPFDAVKLAKILQQLPSMRNQSQFQAENLSLGVGGAKLGIDLPKTEKGLFEIVKFPLFDSEDGLKITNSLPLLIEALQIFLAEVVQNDIPQLEQAYGKQDWIEIEKITHKIKGGVVCLGTRRMYYACQYLERYYKAGHRALLSNLYMQLLSVSRETVETIKDWLSQYIKK